MEILKAINKLIDSSCKEGFELLRHLNFDDLEVYIEIPPIMKPMTNGIEANIGRAMEENFPDWSISWL